MVICMHTYPCPKEDYSLRICLREFSVTAHFDNRSQAGVLVDSSRHNTSSGSLTYSAMPLQPSRGRTKCMFERMTRGVINRAAPRLVVCRSFLQPRPPKTPDYNCQPHELRQSFSNSPTSHHRHYERTSNKSSGSGQPPKRACAPGRHADLRHGVTQRCC